MRRNLLVWLLLLVVVGPIGSAAGAQSQLEPVATYRSEVDATEIEVAGDLAFVTGSAGLEIVSIRDPAHPKRLVFYDCPGAFDVALDPAAQIAVLAIDAAGGGCMDGEGFVVLDIRDPARPEMLSSVQMPKGAHTVTMDGRVLYANQQEETLAVRRLEIWDLVDAEHPRQLSTVEFEGNGPHDSFVRHRPDGRTLLYTANVTAAHVLDVTDPRAPKKLQEVHDPSINYVHAAEVSHDDKVILVSDETAIGNPTGVCGKAPAGADLGALHFYGAAPDGTFADAGLARLGTWNVPAQVSGGASCTIHVFVQSPDSRRVIAAWYKQGVRVADFSDPANVQELGAFMPPNALARQAIPHNGFVYSADLNRGMDVLRFTGTGWPATAGPAEAFRFGSVPATAPASGGLPPALPPPTNPAGRARLAVNVLVRGRRGRRARVDIAIADARGVQVAVARATVAKGRRARIRVELIGLPGRYRWTARAGRRRVARGRVVIGNTVDGLRLPPGQVVRARVVRR